MNGQPIHPVPPSAGDSAMMELVEQLATGLQAGEAVDVEAVCREHPDQADRLRQLWPAIALMADLAQSIGESGGVAVDSGALHPEACLGDFRIVREVGRGGMGVVYEAVQLSLGRRVALKVLPFAATMDARQLQRFQNEARAAAGLEHPHIVPVYAVGSDRGAHYYAMKFIDGQSLAQVLARQAAEPPAAPTQGETAPRAADTTVRPKRDRAYFELVARWGIQAAEALEHAHSLGIVHRDVKPANLLLDVQGMVWVADFGLARTADAGLTMTGDVLGTLRYMSPEQAMAKHGLVDHRTDVYSLGATLYELLTLRPAIEGADRQDILRRIAFDEPPAPRKWERSIPPELETIVLKALEKNPAERYGTARELADDLRRFLDDRPVQARRPTLGMRLARWGRRRQGVVCSAGLGLLLAVATLAVCSLLLWRERERVRTALAEKDRQHRVAERQHRRAEANFYRMLNTTTYFLHRVDEAKVPQVRDALEQQLDRQLQAFRDEAGTDPVALRDAAWSYEHVASYYLATDRYPQAEQRFRLALALYERLAAEYQEDTSIHYPLSRCRNQLAFALYTAGRIAVARDEYGRALAQFRRRLDVQPDCRTHLDFAQFLSRCPLAEFRDPPLALRLARRALELPRDGPDYGEAVCWRTLGEAHYRNGNYRDAIASFQDCIRLSGMGHPRVSFTLAMAHCRLGETTRANEYYQLGVQWMAEKPDAWGRRGPSNRLIRAEAAALLGVSESLPTKREAPLSDK